jgi:signal transduction histidine kinase
MAGPAIHHIMEFREILQRQSSWFVIVCALLGVAAIGWVDYITGWEWSFFVFYAVPILVVVWKAGQPAGFVFAVLCATAWWLAQIEDNPYKTSWGFALAIASRLFYFCVLVVAVAAVDARRELDRKRIATLERAQELEQEILRTSEQEQQRIGRDLHDSLGPHLAAIRYAANFLADDLRKRGEPEAAKAEEIGQLVAEAVSLTRDLARGIFPVQMDSEGLAASLEDLAGTVSRFTGLSVTFSDSANIKVADPEVGMNLYRIAQEAVNNAVKHGSAKSISIALSAYQGFIRLMVADDGKGMSDMTNGGGGIGLHSMQFRARALGGEIHIDSKQNEGTVITCEIPQATSATLL